MMGLGMTELIIILVIALVIFGAGKLPEIGTSLGKSIQNFKKATTEPETPRELPKEDDDQSRKEED
jgi:sec-independent protein translocase protein TatA